MSRRSTSAPAAEETEATQKAEEEAAAAKQKADEEACKKAEAFAQSASLQGEPITRFGFDTLTVHDIAGNDLLLNDSKASATMNTAFPYISWEKHCIKRLVFLYNGDNC